MNNLIKIAVAAVCLGGSVAFAGDVVCPAGMKAFTLQADVDLMMSGCRKDGLTEGTMRVYFKSTGMTHAEGPVVGGMRNGHWVFFDKYGVKTAEVDFKNGDYHGLRVEFHPNGQKSFEEQWANGLLVTPAKTFDPTGKPIAVPPTTPAKK